MSIYNNFRKTDIFSQTYKPISNSSFDSNENLTKAYDEPTYLSFKLLFSPKADMLTYNNVSNISSFDTMPHPLLNNYNVSDESYSAIKYLENINEPKRAELLSRFINLFNILQYDFQWYFQSISGIDDLLKVNPNRGSRTGKDTYITVNCMEALDKRLYHIFSLYRKIVWDDEYQRWMLPEMMRYFTLHIMIADFRNFHAPYREDNTKIDPIGSTSANKSTTKNLINSISSDIVNAGKNFVNTTLNLGRYNNATIPVILKLQQDIIPIHVIECKMCEFDITSFKYYEDLTIDGKNEQKFSFKIKVGNYTEKLYNPILNTTNIDNNINTYHRLNDINKNTFNLMQTYYSNLYNISQNFNDNEKIDHISGTFFNMNEGYYDSLNSDSATMDWINRNLYVKNNSMLGSWVNNLTDFGVGFAKDKLTSTLDSLKMKEFIPGISFNTITAAVAAQDIVGIVGLVRKGVQNTKSGFSAQPSERLDDIDVTFKKMLSDYVNEDVSATEKPIQEYVKTVLNDDKEYDKMINSYQFNLFNEENGLETYEKLVWSKLQYDDNNKSATEKEIFSYVGPSSK